MALTVGSPAPGFSLPDQNGRTVTLGELRGRWVVLYFYPKDDTPGCTTEACEFTAAIEDFAGLDAVVLGCSPDSVSSHAEFAAKHDLAVSLLADPEHEVMKRYEAWGEKVLYGRRLVGVRRSTVLIDPEGRVAHHWRSARAKGHAASVKARLEGLRG